VTTPVLELPEFGTAGVPNGADLTDGMRRLDAIVQLTAIAFATEPPAAPELGDRYIIEAPATGLFTGRALHVAFYSQDGWQFFIPRDGWLAVVDGVIWMFDESVPEWVEATTGGGGGGGDVVGPASSVDNTLARFDGTTGKLIQGSDIVIDDSENVTNVRSIGIKPDGTTSYAFSFKGRQVASVVVPYFTPDTTTTPIALDIFPKGAPSNFTTNTGVAWLDICSTDIEADGTNYECLRLGIFAGGDAHISHAEGGTGTQRNLRLQINGGNVGIGGTISPSSLLTLNGTTIPAIELQVSGNARQYFGCTTSNGNWFTGSVTGDHAIRGMGGRILIGSNSATPVPPIIVTAGNPGRVTLNGGVTTDGGGFKHARVTTGSIGAGASSLVTVTWGTAFADTNYSAVVSVQDSTAAVASLAVVHIESKTASAITVRVENTSAGSLTGTLHAIAVHD
jgi:hypothetical protein